jgi:hypothetical protein
MLGRRRRRRRRRRKRTVTGASGIRACLYLLTDIHLYLLRVSTYIKRTRESKGLPLGGRVGRRARKYVFVLLGLIY